MSKARILPFVLFGPACALMASRAMAAAEAAGGYLSDELAAQSTTAQPLAAPSLLPTLLNVVFSLAFVIGLFLVAVWLYQRWRNGQGTDATGRMGLIKVLDRHFIDAKHSIVVVEVGDEVLTLGLGDDVAVLGRATDPEAVERLRQMAPLPASVMGFKEQLERVGSRLKREEWGRAKQALRTQADEMKALKETMERPRKENL